MICTNCTVSLPLPAPSHTLPSGVTLPCSESFLSCPALCPVNRLPLRDNVKGWNSKSRASNCTARRAAPSPPAPARTGVPPPRRCLRTSRTHRKATRRCVRPPLRFTSSTSAAILPSEAVAQPARVSQHVCSRNHPSR